MTVSPRRRKLELRRHPRTPSASVDPLLVTDSARGLVTGSTMRGSPNAYAKEATDEGSSHAIVGDVGWVRLGQEPRVELQIDRRAPQPRSHRRCRRCSRWGQSLLCVGNLEKKNTVLVFQPGRGGVDLARRYEGRPERARRGSRERARRRLHPAPRDNGLHRDAPSAPPPLGASGCRQEYEKIAVYARHRDWKSAEAADFTEGIRYSAR